ncbi:PKHD-type hydroxylase [Sphingomonas vulcanisoli]|uniref:PKHD-type hydroxylase n=1 Tax=Sphingomonas vulcanisoli TaxID=1658060 RepID=A0ABX0TVQ5_9SPHN|nr:Fe2+-dependent dioxygenase [Sphingomonas vulcanisoli]NIJ08774.1 PKHD-type hydroxylase [Sphingomonas vulcanisoli]
MIVIPALLSPEEASAMRAALDAADWIDGNATSGHQSALAKRNRQLPEDAPLAIELGGKVLDALGRSPVFVAAALPFKVFPPLFNRYGPGDAFDTHIDGAVRHRRGSDFRIRTDLSATLFLSDPESYDGGELVAEGRAPVKLGMGDMILYPATTLHHVSPITRGERVACFFWIQSMVRDEGKRAILFDLDQSIQALAGAQGQDDQAIIRLTGVYHNLLRQWAEL